MNTVEVPSTGTMRAWDEATKELVRFPDVIHHGDLVAFYPSDENAAVFGRGPWLRRVEWDGYQWQLVINERAGGS